MLIQQKSLIGKSNVCTNIICSYVPWNLHEPERDVFDFGDGGRDFSPFLNLSRFLEMAKEEDLFVVFRPGRKEFILSDGISRLTVC